MEIPIHIAFQFRNAVQEIGMEPSVGLFNLRHLRVNQAVSASGLQRMALPFGTNGFTAPALST
jgi:hypothetical protein